MKKFKITSFKTFGISAFLLTVIIGVTITVALEVAQSNFITNTFATSKIDTEIEEDISVDGETLNKRVSVKNVEDATADAYIRVRLTKSPEDASIQLIYSEGALSTPVAKENTWIDGGDGFYYYRYSVAPGTETTELLSGVDAKGFEGNFDVIVYQESCIAAEENRYSLGEENVPTDLSTIKSTFERATEIKEEQ
ncbi:MAG: hypothetical protein IAA25_04825 [Candidatus Ruminococcus intestinipullorum]|nr:hypothetical protein [Candidatus Ruminococcus intestinipullorum]